MKPDNRLFPVLVLALLIAILALANHNALRYAYADWITLSARWQISQWQKGKDLPWTPEQWRAARDPIVRALDVAPENPMLWDDLGYLYALQGFRNLPNEALAHPYFRQALAYYREGIARRPNAAHTWANIATLLAYLDPSSEKLWHAFDRALEYGPNEPEVLTALAQIVFRQWDRLDPRRRSAFLERYAAQPANVKKQIAKIAVDRQVVIPEALR